MDRHIKLIEDYYVTLGLSSDDAIESCETIAHEPLNRCFRLLALGKHYTLHGTITQAMDCFMQCDILIKNGKASDPDLQAMTYCELAHLHKLFFDNKSALFISKATELAISKKVRTVVALSDEALRFISLKSNPRLRGMALYNHLLQETLDSGLIYRYIIGLYHRFTLRVDNQDYYNALDDYYAGQKLAKSLGFDIYEAMFEWGLGQVKRSQKDIAGAIKCYSYALNATESVLVKTKALISLAGIYEGYHNRDKYLQNLNKALSLSKKEGAINRVPLLHLLLGRFYETELKDLSAAEKHYKQAEHAQSVLSSSGMVLLDLDQQIALQRQVFMDKFYAGHKPLALEESLSFIYYSDYRKALTLFQYSLLMYQRDRFPDLGTLQEKLNLPQSTLQAIKAKLTRLGYPVPDFRKHCDRHQAIGFVPGIKTYLSSIADLNWKEADERFKRDMLTLLIERYGGKKTKICDHLKVSDFTLRKLCKSVLNVKKDPE